MNHFLGHLPIELKLNSNQTQIQIIPKYFPYDDDFFGKIYYRANQLYLCLEIEDPRHKFVIRRMHRKKYNEYLDNTTHIYYKKKLHTKFFGIHYWTINNSNLNQTFTYNISDIYNRNCLSNVYSHIKYGYWTEYKLKIRATYRYDFIPYCEDSQRKQLPFYKTRTNIFSNELELTLTANNIN